MNKTQLIDAVAAKAGLTKVETKKAVEAFFEVVAETVKNDKIQVAGFGTFSTSVRAAREGKNPRTGEKITIAAKNQLKFKAGSDLEAKIQ